MSTQIQKSSSEGGRERGRERERERERERDPRYTHRHTDPAEALPSQAEAPRVRISKLVAHVTGECPRHVLSRHVTPASDVSRIPPSDPYPRVPSSRPTRLLAQPVKAAMLPAPLIRRPWRHPRGPLRAPPGPSRPESCGGPIRAPHHGIIAPFRAGPVCPTLPVSSLVAIMESMLARLLALMLRSQPAVKPNRFTPQHQAVKPSRSSLPVKGLSTGHRRGPPGTRSF